MQVVFGIRIVSARCFIMNKIEKIATMKYAKFILLSILLLQCFHSMNAQTLADTAQAKINEINTLIAQAEQQGIDALKEKMTVRTAEVFLGYADWDEAHIAENTSYFAMVSALLNQYNTTAAQMANDLPDFERTDVIKMLDSSVVFLNKLIDGTYTRKTIPKIDWANVTHDGDQLTAGGRPAFLEYYTWKPDIPELTDYFGDNGGFFMQPRNVTNESGAVNLSIPSESGNIGFVFISHKNPPQWAIDKYGPGFDLKASTGTRFTDYDIDNPGAREMMGFLLDGTVPQIMGKKYADLGYMLVNEPHFFTTKKASGILNWASGPVTDYTIDKFKAWLQNRHGDINTLNSLWGTSFTDFEAVTIDIPISEGLIGTAKWYDWHLFNNHRVTDWYTFLKNKIIENDPNAKVHLKIMPWLWSDNQRGHGIDFEALTVLSEIIGNDAGASHNRMWGGPFSWEENYSYDWREMCMSYDFLKSVSPEKIILNSEAHYLSTTLSRDLYLDPAYARATYWLAHTQGLNVSQTWYWPRREDGSLRMPVTNSYAGSNNQQPRVTQELHSTLMDLNSFSEEIMAMQRQEKPIRIFYSETSAINKSTHMDDVFELYESLFFEGVPIGFATAGIISRQNQQDWDLITVHKTEYATQEEFDALQSYLDNGGTVILDDASLEMNEYGQVHTTQLSGNIIRTNGAEDIKNAALSYVANKLPEVKITETNGRYVKACTWKSVKGANGNNIVSVVNLGNTPATLDISLRNGNISALKNLLNGSNIDTSLALPVYGTLFLEVIDKEPIEVPTDFSLAQNYPNPFNAETTISFDVSETVDARIDIFNILGQKINSFRWSTLEPGNYQHVWDGKNKLGKNVSSGLYIYRLKAGSFFKSKKMILLK